MFRFPWSFFFVDRLSWSATSCLQTYMCQWQYHSGSWQPWTALSILLGLVICLFNFYSSPNWKELSRSRLVQFRFSFAVVFEMLIHLKYYSLVIRAGYISSKPIRCLRPCISWTWFSAFSSFYSCRVDCITFKQLRSQRLMLQGHVQKLRRIC